MKKAILFSIGVLFFLTGCGTSINLTKYSPIQAPKASHMPSPSELENKKPTVVIMNINDNGIETAIKARAGKAMGTRLNTELAQSGEVNIIKRLKNTNLENEVKRAEITKSLGGNGVDYIVTGKIDNASYNWKFYEARTWRDKKGRVHYIPPYIKYIACVSGNIQIYSLPDLIVKSTIPVKSCVYETVNARSSYQAKRSNPALVRSAAISAIDDAKYPLENFFAPKGYILEIRRNEDGELIAKLTIGSEDGVKEGDKVDIYTLKDYINPITNKKTIQTVKIAKGKVSNQIGPHFSWIIIDKDDINPGYTLHIGDFAKIKKEFSFF